MLLNLCFIEPNVFSKKKEIIANYDIELFNLERFLIILYFTLIPFPLYANVFVLYSAIIANLPWHNSGYISKSMCFFESMTSYLT